jgi:serine phosphatase RsbU (regulator of sigma subunit)
MYRNLDELNKNLEQKVADRTQEVREKSEQILDSIRYSKRIQTAIMPLEEKLKTVLPQHFIIFLPRDIVSGDFYWFTEMDTSIFLAVVDCTGHGVPGALLAIMGDIFLKEIINTNRIFEPAKILEELHKKVRTQLKQDEKEAEAMDGMDICLCRIDREKSKLYFAGAKRPLYIVRAGGADQDESMSRFVELCGDRKSIGGRQKEINRIYTNHEIAIQKGDMIYLTSDGFSDQPNRDIKKYGSKKLKGFLIKLAQFPVEQQKKYMLEELRAYRGEEKQRDDITIFGIRLSNIGEEKK